MKPADLTDRTVYVLAHDVVNPTPDRRRRGGALAALERWPAGTLIHCRLDAWTNRRRPLWRFSAKRLHGDIVDTHDGFAALVNALEPVHTLDSVLYSAKESQAIISPSEILAELIDSAHLSLAQVEIAIAALIARHAAEGEIITEATTGGLGQPAPAPLVPSKPEIPPPVTVPMTRLDAWATIRALAVANGVPAHYDSHRDEERVRTWVAERILRLVAPATDAAATVDTHCTGGCGDITVTRAAFQTGRCPNCGRDLYSVEGARGD